MMQKATALFSILLVIGCFTAACTRTRVVRVDPRPSLLEFDESPVDYLKRVAVLPAGTGEWADNAERQTHYFDRFIAALQLQSANVQWVAQGQDGFPDYALQWGARDSGRVAVETAHRAQGDGFNALLSTALADIRSEEKKSGFWLFRKTRFTVTVALRMDILDPFTAAKSAAVIKQDQRRVTGSDYEMVRDRRWAEAPFLQDMIQNLIAELVEKAAADIQSMRWQAAVIHVAGDRIGLAAGSRQGLSIGDHLAIFEGKTVAGYQDREYIAPGFKTGEVHIIEVHEGSASAQMIGPAEIRVGDIAVAGD